MVDAKVEAARAALRAYAGFDAARVAPLSGGLINQTFAVETPQGRFVLQRLNPIFDPRIHHNIEAVTRRLQAQEMTTPLLVKTRDQQLWSAADDGSVWRLLTRVEGDTLHTLSTPAQAYAAARLVARFHSALAGLAHHFEGVRLGVHDTAAHLQKLRSALQEHQRHVLFAEVQPLAEKILQSAAELAPLPALAPCIGHGDLKISNLLFRDATSDHCEAVCLIDLDTLAPMPLAHEMGDAWRSWCNRGLEGDREATFDLAMFEASLHGYRAGAAERSWTLAERRALLLGPELISVELSARFAADALYENYFGWDDTRFVRAGEHNLARAHGQYALHCATVSLRTERQRLLAAL